VVEHEVRRIVTVVTSDLKGSTSLGERLDPESLREVLTRYFDEMRVVLETYGGTIEKIIGDAIVAVFGLPERRDDDALRAVTAAAATQAALAELNEILERTWGVRLTTRTGVATGDVVVGEASAGQHVLTGPALQLATAMEQNAPAMEVLVHASTFALVQGAVDAEPVEPFVPKGMTETVEAVRLIGIRAPSEDRGTDGGPRRRTCRDCGAENAPEARACMTCGAMLAVDVPRHESRKTVSIVFADPKPTTSSGTAPTPEALRDVMSHYFEAMRIILERHGGTVEKFIGDAVMAVFGLPVRHEDDALRATRAAFDMQAALPPLNTAFERDHGITLQNHIGVNTGEVVAGDASLGQRLVTGDAVNVAARLEQAAHAHEVLIGDLTFRLIRDAVDVEVVEPLRLKGKAEPVPAYRLLAIRSFSETARREDSPMVGRDEEFALLTRMLAETIGDHSPRAVTVIGDAGVGKTRLTREFLRVAAASTTVLHGRCLPYGDGITFWPLIEVVGEAVGIREDDPPEVAVDKIAHAVGNDMMVTDRVASVLGLSPTSYQVGELFWGIRRFFEVFAAKGPIVVLFDDIHWAEPTFLDLIDHLTSASGTSLLLLCTARHEILDDRPGWGEAPACVRIQLRPLSEADASQVIAHLLGEAGLDEDARQRIVTASEGNPLFVEQLLSMLIDNGRLQRRGDRWVAASDLSDLAIPPTIHALLAARLDALPLEERTVVEPASVIGLSFSQDAVAALVGDAVRDEVALHLGGLSRKQLVREQPDPSADDAIYRFHHLLIRDAAYQGLLKRARSVLHERFVDWADVVNAQRGRSIEFEEILGYHLEQAYSYRSELGPLDDHGVRLGVRASERLGSAGHRALDRGDIPAAASLLGRAAATLPADHPNRPWLLIRAGEAQFELGGFTAAGASLDEAIEAARIRSDEAIAATARIERLRLRYMTDASGSDASLADQVRAALPVLEEAGEEGGLARAWRLLTYIEMAATRWGAAERTADAMLEHARLSGDRLMEIRGLPALANTARLGPLPVAEALLRCEHLLARAEGDRRAQAIILRANAYLRAMQGDFDTARLICAQSRATLLELGWNFDAALGSIESGPIEMLAGDPVAAETELRRDYETLDRMEERNYITTTAAYLAEALYRQDRRDEAATFASFSETTAAEDDLLTQFLWRGVRGKLLAHEGRYDEGVAVGREAVRLARTSDDPVGQGNALVDLAQALAIAGRHGEADEAFLEALAAFDQKGSTASAAIARTLFDGVLSAR
jgi:class 3 adenylate cyclase/tetratricopeptide (TPR) repeat protein